MSRFDAFTVGELQAMVTAFAVAGAYDNRRPFDNPIWSAVARDAQRALRRAVDAEDDAATT